MRIIFIVLLCTSMGLSAQRGERAQINPTDAAKLRSQQLTLALDLSDKQSTQVQELILKQAELREEAKKTRANYKAEGKNPTAEERTAFKSKMLDAQIVHQRAMKNILNAEQYELWRKLKAKRNGHKQGGKGRRPHQRTKRR